MPTISRAQPSFRPSGVPADGCPLCGEVRRQYLFVVRGLPVVRCPGCGLLSLSPQPDLSDIRTFYRDLSEGIDPRLLWSDGATERDAARNYLDALRERGVTSGQILLVAPPNHCFVAEAAARGFQVARHLSAADLDLPGDLGLDQCDAAVVLYQLEKSGNPVAALRRLQEALKPDAVILLAIPSLDSWPAGFFGDHWTEWRPENRYYFTRALVEATLIKAGFASVSINAESRWYTLEHVYDRARAFPRTGLTRAIKSLYQLLPASLNRVRVRIVSSGVVATAIRTQSRERPLVSIVLPAYNEGQTFPVLMDALLAKQLDGADKEIIVVESNSKDGTREAALGYVDHPEVKVVLQDRPRGKGNAVREGLAHATGDVVMIQDADLEYDLNDYDALLEPLLGHRAAFVLGARHGGKWKMRQFGGQEGLSTALNLGHLFFTGLINILYGQRMRDPFTMYKLFRRDCLHGLELERNRFDFDHELVIKLVQKGYEPLEIPVNYRARSFREGKKVRMFRDPLTWLWVDFKYRLPQRWFSRRRNG